MINEQIENLAQEYVDKVYGGDTDFYDEAVNVISFISARFCIVEKSKASELCRLTLEHGNSVDYGLIDGLTDIVCDIFREQYQEEAEK